MNYIDLFDDRECVPAKLVPDYMLAIWDRAKRVLIKQRSIMSTVDYTSEAHMIEIMSKYIQESVFDIASRLEIRVKRRPRFTLIHSEGELLTIEPLDFWTLCALHGVIILDPQVDVNTVLETRHGTYEWGPPPVFRTHTLNQSLPLEISFKTHADSSIL